ncbi:MAG: hypothetical protein IPJ12_00285 [Betaproteobacteria bacterium]|nr:hypothetical protein [Betaproteobacteria bacterium]
MLAPVAALRHKIHSAAIDWIIVILIQLLTRWHALCIGQQHAPSDKHSPSTTVNTICRQMSRNFLAKMVDKPWWRGWLGLREICQPPVAFLMRRHTNLRAHFNDTQSNLLLANIQLHRINKPRHFGSVV